MPGKARDRDDVERTFRDMQDIVAAAQREKIGWHKEKQLLLLLGVVAIAVVGFVGVAILMGGSKEKDLARHRCEMDYQVKSVWDYSEKLKKEQPGIAPNDVDARVDQKRPEFSTAAKAACAGTK
jgi:hypothetical protein